MKLLIATVKAIEYALAIPLTLALGVIGFLACMQYLIYILGNQV
jgi:hypothetical protein